MCMYMYVHACHPALTIVVSLPDTVALKNYGKVCFDRSFPLPFPPPSPSEASYTCLPNALGRVI